MTFQEWNDLSDTKRLSAYMKVAADNRILRQIIEDELDVSADILIAQYEEEETTVASQIDQAPIARVIVHGDLPAEVLMYAPGLPVGEHDLYCEPTALKGGENG